MDASEKKSPFIRERIAAIRKNNAPSHLLGAAAAFCVMLLHPILFDDLYFNINRYKQAVYCCAAFFALIAYVVLSILRKKPAGSDNPGRFRFSIADWGMMLFSIVSLVSCVLSTDPHSAFTGDEGRKSGLLFILSMSAFHIVVSRTPSAVRRAVEGLLISGTLVALLGVLNFFNIDPFGFYGPRLARGDVTKFISTIGNIDFFAAFLSLFLPCAMIFCVKTQGIRSFLCFGAIAVGASAAIAARADSAIIVLAVSLFSCMLFGVRSRENLARAFFAIAAVLVGIAGITVLINAHPDGHMTLEYSLQKHLVKYPEEMGIGAVILLGASYVLFKSKRLLISKKTARFLRRLLWFAFFCAAFVLASVFFYYTFIDTETELSGAMDFFRFEDKWGSSRGGVWVRCMKLYDRSSLRVKLVGLGPDLLRKPLNDAYGKEILSYCKIAFDNAHNELIQYLLTLGALGLVSYLWFVYGGMHTLYMRMKQCPYAAAAFAAAAAYLVHSLITVNQPITTPLLFMLLSAGASCRKTEGIQTAAKGKETKCETSDQPDESAPSAL